jgi:hypothetical protein
MRKLLLALPMVMCVSLLKAQTNPIADTTKKDTVRVLDEIKESVLDNIPTITIDDNDMGDNGQNISSVLTAGRDPFYSATSFNFSPVRFRLRGYDNDNNTTYINNLPTDNLDNGYTPWGLWGGLNDVFRLRDVNVGLRYNTFAFGDIASSTNIDARASKQRKQTSLSYALSNRNYNHRVMLTHSTGLSKKGWAFTVSGSFRGADEGYVKGTYYNSYSYFAAIDKKLGQKHLLSLTGFGANVENGRQGGATQEIMDIAGDNYYNPNWGYQDGKKRNVSVGKTHQPVIILTHDFRVNNKTSITTSAGYSFGDRSVTAFDWYNAPDPRPDYYRYLPSYQTDTAVARQVREKLANDESARQINWQNLYNVNRQSFETIQNANGIAGNTVSGRRSRYIVEERVINTKKLNFNSVMNTRFGKNVDFTAGASYQSQKNHYYKKVDDLLGGDFYVNLNQFAERDFPLGSGSNQYDIDNPNRILHVGDKFGYDYDITINKMAGWAQQVVKLNKVDFFTAFEVSRTEFWRTGNVRNGLYPNNSYGQSKKNEFNNYAVKGGLTYKFDGRNYIYANAAYMTRAPYFENAYISPRTRDFLQNNVTSEKIFSTEGGYIMNAPKVKLRISGYFTKFEDGMNVMSFYHEIYRNFVNYAINNIDKVHYGGEFGRQNAIVTLDNTTGILGNQTIYMKNFRVSGTPQEAYSLGFTYRSPNYWFLSVTGNYFDQMWLEPNPLRRTEEAVSGIDPKSDLYRQIIDQVQFDHQFTLDFFGGYSWKLPRSISGKKNMFLYFNAGVNNILNNKKIITGGYEQLRYDYGGANVNEFPPKLYYAYGLNYFASVSFRF